MPQSPILIVGGGLAGLFCALKLAPRKAVVLATAPLGEGASSVWAQGGVAAAMSEGDTPEKHARDTMAAAAGIANEAIVLGMTREAGDRVRDLLAYGAPFDRDSTGGLLQSREAAHSERRIARVRGDAAGQAIMAALIAATTSLHLSAKTIILLPRNGASTATDAACAGSGPAPRKWAASYTDQAELGPSTTIRAQRRMTSRATASTSIGSHPANMSRSRSTTG